MKFRVLTFIFILLFQFSCKKDSTLDSFTLNNKKIEDSNDNLNITNESFLEIIYIQADKDVSLIDRKDVAKKVHAIGEELYKYIEDLKNIIKEKNSTEYVNELFFNGDDISQEGEEFLMYIKNYKNGMTETLQNTNPRIVAMVENNFDLADILDRRGQKTNWLTLNFKDFSPIISITKLSTMQTDIRRIESQYLAGLLGVKLNAKTQNLLDKIKKETNPQLGDNTKIDDVTTDDNSINSEENQSSLETKAEDSTIENSDTKEIEKEEISTNNQDDKEVATKEITKEEPVKEVKKVVPKVVKATKKTHTVKSGENLYRISLKYKMSPKKIRKLNHMKNNNIVVGQVLKLE